MSLDLPWFQSQVDAYRSEQPRFKRFADLLDQILQAIARRVAPLAIVKVRAKTVASFAEKVVRKKDKYRDPVHQLTDLCGGRVIVHTKADVDVVCGFIRRHFSVDEANSLDAADRLRSTEFGYRSVHYVVELKRGDPYTGLAPGPIAADLFGLKAEIQVRTIAQHAWADIGHDRLYKSLLKMPGRFEREAARIAALLENADEAFSRLVDDIDRYRSYYEAYLDPKQINEELELLQAVRANDPNNAGLAERIVPLMIGGGRWADAVRFVESFPGSKTAALLMWLGFGLCQLHKADRRGLDFLRGRDTLAAAIQAAPRNLEALAMMADTWIDDDPRQALGWYERAYKIAPSEPRILAGYVSLKVALEKRLDAVAPMVPAMEQAVERCHAQAADKINLPWALYCAGEFALLLGRPYEALQAYLAATRFTSQGFMLDQAMQGVEQLAVLGDELPQA